MYPKPCVHLSYPVFKNGTLLMLKQDTEDDAEGAGEISSLLRIRKGAY